VRRALALLVLVAPLAALAQEEGVGGVPAKKEPKRVLDQIVKVLDDTRKKDAGSAVAALKDANWAVRAVAAIRLGVLGLDEPTVRALRDAARPGSKKPADDDASVKAAETFAATVKPKEGKVDPASAGDDGIRTYVSLVQNELSVRRAPASDLRAAILGLPAYAEAAADPRANDFVARMLMAFGDDEQILKDLGAKNTAAAVEGGGKKVFDWYHSNAQFLYLHPKDGCLRVDLAARSAGTSTDSFREKSPWGPDEGPNAPPRKKREK
jgi:hypothetical protein